MSNVKPIDIKVSGLKPYEQYSFSFTNKGGNWPIRVSPLSGEFFATNKDAIYSIKTFAYFCPTTGYCPPTDPTVFFNMPNTDMSIPGLDIGPESLYSVMGLSVVEKSTGKIAFTYPCEVECEDCLPKLGVESINVVMDDASGNNTNISTKISGLIPNQLYRYSITGLDANWPVKVLPISGYIQTPQDNYSINAIVSFCPSVDGCSESTALPYNSLENCANAEELYSILQVSVSPVGDKVYQTATKSNISLVCRGCIKKPSATIPSMLELNDSNKISFNTELKDLVTGASYQYVFSSIDSNWPVSIYPISGIVSSAMTNVNIPTKLMFCRTTGVCSSDDTLRYTLDNQCLDKLARTKLLVTQLDCDNPVSFTSNELMAVCNDCIPKVQVSLPSSSTLDRNSKNTSNFIANLSNLDPGKSYKYSFKGIDANWPATIYPVSGSFLAQGSTAQIPVSLTFCSSTGLCPRTDDRVLVNSLDESCYAAIVDSDKHTRFKLEVRQDDCNTAVYSSNDMMVMCIDCLSKIVIDHGSLGETLSGPGNNNYQVNTTVSNLNPGQRYTYTINGLDGNWPMVVSKQSGEFLAVSSNKLVQTDLSFCFPSGSCAIDNRDVYSNYRSNSVYKNSNKKFFNFNMSIRPKSCDVAPVISEDFSVVCNNCLPDTNLSVAISGAPILTLPLNCCSGTRLIAANITGAVPGESHTYNWISGSENIILSPSSGTLLLNKNGVGSIMALMSTNLTNREQAILECRVRNTVSNSQANSFVVVRCGPECN
jgi:hypothetical protein